MQRYRLKDKNAEGGHERSPVVQFFGFMALGIVFYICLIYWYLKASRHWHSDAIFSSFHLSVKSTPIVDVMYMTTVCLIGAGLFPALVERPEQRSPKCSQAASWLGSARVDVSWSINCPPLLYRITNCYRQ